MAVEYKRCGCGIRYTEAQWRGLPYAGVMHTEDETGRYETEMRHCSCGTTLAIEHRVGDGQAQAECPGCGVVGPVTAAGICAACAEERRRCPDCGATEQDADGACVPPKK